MVRPQAQLDSCAELGEGGVRAAGDSLHACARGQRAHLKQALQPRRRGEDEVERRAQKRLSVRYRLEARGRKAIGAAIEEEHRRERDRFGGSDDSHETLSRVDGHHLPAHVLPHFDLAISIDPLDARKRAARMSEQPAVAALHREHVVGQEARPAATQLERERGLAGTRAPEEGHRLPVADDGAGVEDLKPLQQRREGQDLRDQQPLPARVREPLRIALQQLTVA